MPELNWDLTELIECLEVLPQSEEYGTEHTFEVERNGLLLRVTVWPHESVVYLSVRRVDGDHTVIGMALYVRGRVQHVKEERLEFLRFHDALPAPSRFSYNDFAEDLHNTEALSYSLTVTLRVNPDIAIEFERYKA